MAIKNNVTRMLESRGFAYTPCELPNEKLGAVEVAEYLGVDPALVYKTIVVTRPGGGKPILAVVPGPNEVDLKALAKTLGEKKVSVTNDCIECNFCLDRFECPALYHDQELGRTNINRQVCADCGLCLQVCPKGAIVEA